MLTQRDVTINYLETQGRIAACRITIPAGTRAIAVMNPSGFKWAVDDVPLLIELTGNSHDPQYRYAYLPDEAMQAP
jgi:hypothetical protein